jgi:general secretion pathway protein C
MIFAKNLASWRDLSPEQWIAQANRLLPPVVIAVLVVAIAHRAAGLTWRLLEGPGEPGPVPAAVVAPGGTDPLAVIAYASLDGWKPFGEPPAPGAEPDPTLAIDAPETSLPLTLWGTNGANREDVAKAQISSGRAAQRTYLIGDVIESASGASLYAVFSDHVILDRGAGRFETLRLPDVETMSQAGARGSTRRLAAAPALPPQTNLSQAVDMQEALSNAAALLADSVRAVPAVEGGQTIGFRLQPAENEEVFRSLGFEPGDVLMEVNGLKLNNPQNAAQVFAALGEATQANVMVQRNGQQQALVVDMGQIERLLESRQ